MKLFLLAVTLGVMQTSCRQGLCPTDDPYALKPEPSAYTRAWFPYTNGQRFVLTSGADTLRCSVPRIGAVGVEYDQGDECPTGVGNGIGGLVIVGEDTLEFRTAMYPDDLWLRYRSYDYDLADSLIHRHGDTLLNGAIGTAEINGVVRLLTVRAVVPDSAGITVIFLSNGIGVSGVARDGQIFGLAQ